MAAKLFTLLALVACVAADASYRGFGYGRIGYGHNLAGYRAGYRGYRGYNGYNRYGNYARGYSHLHKRDAEAEPEADAGYTTGLSTYSSGYGYAPYSAGYARYSAGYAPYRAGYRASGLRYGARYPAARVGSFYGRLSLHKRSADAEPEADAGYLRSAAYYAPSHYRYGGARSYEYRSPQGARGYAGRNYYGAGRSYYGRVHGVHKRSAEPSYFRRYYGSGRSYQAVYRPYSGYRSAIYHH